MSSERNINNIDSDGVRGMSVSEIDEFVNETFDRGEFPVSNDVEIPNVSADDSETPYVELQDSNSAFGRRIREFKIINFGFKDIERFLLSAYEPYQTKITKAVTEFNTIKTLQMNATQNVIRNKFKSTYTNRFKNEQDVNQAMKPLIARSSASLSTIDKPKNSDSSTHNLLQSSMSATKTTTKTSNPLQLNSNRVIKLCSSTFDPNTLCDILRILLSTLPVNSDNHNDNRSMQQINSILNELRELEIIV